MWSSPSGILTFTVGVGLMVAAVLFGNSIQPDVAELGLQGYGTRDGFIGLLKFQFFAFGFPLGIGICAVGAMHAGGTPWRRLLWFGALVVLGTLAAVLVPLVLGRSSSTAFFGTGGVMILLLIVATTWLWGQHRARLPQESRRSADLQGAGYLCFGMAAWNLCGVGGMPSFALAPETMLETGSHAFAVGQMKAVMALLILGWAFTAMGYRRAQ